MKYLLRTLVISMAPAVAMAGVDPSDSEFEQLSSNLPVVPVSSIIAAESGAENDMARSKSGDDAEAEAPVDAKSRVESDTDDQTLGESRYVTLKPGINEIIPIAVSHANRITFPFEDPKIRTTSSASFDVEDNILHLSSNTPDRPITAFITDAEDPQLAMSVTFVPRRIPPVDLILQFDEQYTGTQYRSTARAEAWEKSNAYTETLRNVLRDVAIGALPDGYTLDTTPNLSKFSGCKQSGLSFDWSRAQNVEGHSLTVTVGLVKNISSELIEFRESSCAAIDVRAVAANPNPLLMPGDLTEVYVVRSEPVPFVDPSRVRPSLVGGE